MGIQVEPVVSGRKETTRPLTFFIDGEKGRGNTQYMAAPFTAKVLPRQLDIIVA